MYTGKSSIDFDIKTVSTFNKITVDKETIIERLLCSDLWELYSNVTTECPKLHLQKTATTSKSHQISQNFANFPSKRYGNL